MAMVKYYESNKKIRISVEVTGYLTLHDIVFFALGEGFNIIYRPIKLEAKD